MCTTDDFMTRLEMIIVCTTLYEENQLDMPCEAMQIIDLCGPVLMEGLRRKMKWSRLQLASELIVRRNNLAGDAGAPTLPPELVDKIKALTEKVERGA